MDDLKVDILPPNRPSLKTDLQSILTIFGNFLPVILELSQLKLTTEKIAIEIQKVSRQISNLERKVEDINSQIKFIKNALMEKENFEACMQLNFLFQRFYVYMS